MDMKDQTHIDLLDSGLPRFVIEAAFAVMVAAALCSYSAVNSWMSSHIPVLAGVVNTFGMVVMYYAILRGMKELPHPLTVLWWIAIGVNILDFILYCLGDSAQGLTLVTAAALPLIYLPLGILILVWYRGRLAHVGLWMIIRIMTANLVPVLFYMTGILESSWGLAVMEIITISVELWYAWVLRRVLV